MTCEVSRRRAAMTDEEFDADVARALQFGDHEEDPGYYDEPAGPSEPCGICGSPGACGYDAEGRPMIHTTELGE